MKIDKYTEFKKLTEEEVKQQAINIYNFLQKTHSFMLDKKELSNKIDENTSSLAIELRALRRDRKEKVFYKSFKLYRFTDTEFKRLHKFLKELNDKEIVYCLYYSVFAYNNAIDKNGEKTTSWTNKISVKNAVTTQILIMDFDDITEDDFILERLKLVDLGLDTIDIFSGHGYQSIILLDNVITDKDILKKFTNLMLAKGFKVDSKIKDCARVMRLPYTFNSKEFAKDIENPTILATEITYETDRRYSVKDVFRRIETLQTVDTTIKIEVPEEEIEVEIIEESETVEESEIEVLEQIECSTEELQELYTMLNIEELDKPILKMLQGFRKGYANSMLLVLTLYLKEKGYSKSVISKAMQVLAVQNRFNYAWDKDVVTVETDRFYYSHYEWRKIFADDLKIFGYVEYNLQDKSTVVINNYVFNNLTEISSSAFYIYINLILEQHKTNKNIYTIDEIADVAGYKRRAVLKHLDDLVKVKLLDKKRAYKKAKEEYKFTISKYPTDMLGFTKINIYVLKMLLDKVKNKELNQTQFLICLYFKYICYNNKQEACVSQETLASAIGVARTTIVEAFKKIEKLELIQREKEHICDFKFKYNYTIQY